MSHTKGELKAEKREGSTYQGHIHLFLNGRAIAKMWQTQEDRQSNAARLALCWNSHDDLLAACEYTHRLLTENVGQLTHAIALQEAAIAKAKNKSGGKDGGTEATAAL